MSKKDITEKTLESYNENKQNKQEGENTMSSIALDNMINKAITNERKEIAINMNKKGLSSEDIAEVINCKVDVVKSWLSSKLE